MLLVGPSCLRLLFLVLGLVVPLAVMIDACGNLMAVIFITWFGPSSPLVNTRPIKPGDGLLWRVGWMQRASDMMYLE